MILIYAIGSYVPFLSVCVAKRLPLRVEQILQRRVASELAYIDPKVERDVLLP